MPWTAVKSAVKNLKGVGWGAVNCQKCRHYIYIKSIPILPELGAAVSLPSKQTKRGFLHDDSFCAVPRRTNGRRKKVKFDPICARFLCSLCMPSALVATAMAVLSAGRVISQNASLQLQRQKHFSWCPSIQQQQLCSHKKAFIYNKLLQISLLLWERKKMHNML